MKLLLGLAALTATAARTPVILVADVGVDDAAAFAPDGWVHLGDDVLNDCSSAKSCGARTVWLDAAAPSWQENAYSTMSAADREKRRRAAEAVDVATAVDRTIGGLAELPDAVDGALS